MPRSGVSRLVVGIAVAAVVVLCAIVQSASDALARDSVPSSAFVPRLLPVAYGEDVYRAIDRFAQPTFVEQSLSARALAGNDTAAAERYALRMPASPWRDEALANVASARGQETLAYEYYLAAGNVATLQQRIDAIARRDPREALARERALASYLEAQRVHPDAAADAMWHEGLLLARIRDRAGALDAYQRALAASPLNMTYLLSAANEALVDGDIDAARALYRRALATIDPRSSDAYAGLGLVALREGKRTQALEYAQRARASDPNSADLRWLERELR